jgi:hypothetical protein
VVVRLRAPLTIETPMPGPGDGVGVGDGVGAGVGDGVDGDGEYDDPQPSEIAKKTVAIEILRAAMIPPLGVLSRIRAMLLPRGIVDPRPNRVKSRKRRDGSITNAFSRFRVA